MLPAARVWDGEQRNQFRGLDFEAAIGLLLALTVASTLHDLSPLRSVDLHKLKGARKGQWAMTVNPRWRICFEVRATLMTWRSSTITKDRTMAPVAHPGRLLKRELIARGISANRLSLDRAREGSGNREARSARGCGVIGCSQKRFRYLISGPAASFQA